MSLRSIAWFEVFDETAVDEQQQWTRLSDEESQFLKNQPNSVFKILHQMPSRSNPSHKVTCVFDMKSYTYFEGLDYSRNPTVYKQVDQGNLIHDFRVKDASTLMFIPSSVHVHNERKNVLFYKDQALEAFREACQSWPHDDDHCASCGRTFDWTRWRHECNQCQEQFCSECLAPSAMKKDKLKDLLSEEKQYWLDEHVCLECFGFRAGMDSVQFTAVLENFNNQVNELLSCLFATGQTSIKQRTAFPCRTPSSAKSGIKSDPTKAKSLLDPSKTRELFFRFENPYLRQILPALLVVNDMYKTLYYEQALHYLTTINSRLFAHEVSSFKSFALPLLLNQPENATRTSTTNRAAYDTAIIQFINALATELALFLRGEAYAHSFTFFSTCTADGVREAIDFLYLNHDQFTSSFEGLKLMTTARMYGLFGETSCCRFLQQQNTNDESELLRSVLQECGYNVSNTFDRHSSSARRQHFIAFALECSAVMKHFVAQGPFNLIDPSKLHIVLNWLLNNRIQIVRTVREYFQDRLFPDLRMIATFQDQCASAPHPDEFKRFFYSINPGAAQTIASFAEDANKTAKENEETLYRMIISFATNCSSAIRVYLKNPDHDFEDSRHELKVKNYLQPPADQQKPNTPPPSLAQCVSWLLDHRALLAHESLKGTIRNTFSRFTIAEAFQQAAVAASRYSWGQPERARYEKNSAAGPSRNRSPWPMLNLLEDCYFNEDLRKAAFPNSTTANGLALMETDLNLTVQKLEQKLRQVGAAISTFNFSSAKVNAAPAGTHWQVDLVNVFDDSSAAATAVSAIFLYSLDAVPLYRLLNTCLREDKPLREAENCPYAPRLFPLKQALQNFLTTMPGRPQVLYRGQAFRCVENLDESAPPFKLETFTSTSTKFDIAYQAFLQGNRAGSFLIYVCYNAVDISPFSMFPDEGEVLLPIHAVYETVHRVPLSHLAIMNQRFDVACMVSVTGDQVSSDLRVEMNFEAMSAVSKAYREIQNFFMAPKLMSPTGPMTVLDSLNYLLLPPQKKQGDRKNHLMISAQAGMGKSTLSIYLNSYVNEHKLQGYHSLLISLPAIGKDLFSPDALEKHVQRRLRFTDQDMQLLKKHKLLLVLDSLDEVSLSHWPRDQGIGRGMHIDQWPHLRVILTCRGEHLQLYNLNMNTLSCGRGHTFGIEVFDKTAVKNLMKLWIPSPSPPPPRQHDDSHSHEMQAYHHAQAEANECRENAFKEYSQHPASFQTPFMLYLLAHAHHAKLRGGSGNGNGNDTSSSTTNYNQSHVPSSDAARSTAEQQQQEEEASSLPMASPNRLAGAGGSAFNTTGQVSSQRSQFQRERAAALQKMNPNREGGNFYHDCNDDFGDDEFKNTSTETRSAPQLLDPEKYLGVTFANVSGITGIYELGIKALIVQNILHIYHDPKPAAVRRLVNDVFEWSMLLSVMMLADGNMWKGTIDDFPDIFLDEYQTWFGQDATTMVLLAPLRISGYSALSLFEFRHKSVHEFLVAYAAANCTSTRILSFLRKIDFGEHPNVQLFFSMLSKNTDLVQTADASNAIKSSRLLKFLGCVSAMRASRVCIQDITNDVYSNSSNQAINLDDDENNSNDDQAPPPPSSPQLLDCSSVDLSSVTHLELNCPDHFAKPILDRCTKLETLIFSDPTTGDVTLRECITNNSSTLRCIDLAGTSVTDETIQHMFRKINRFEALNLSGCSFTRESLVLLGDEQLHFIRYLNLSNDEIDQVITDDIMMGILKTSKNLQNLNLSNCPKLTSKAFALIASKLPDLIALDLGDTHLDDSSFQSILSSLTQLTRLRVANARQLGRKNRQLEIHNIGCRHLMNLNMTGTHVGDFSLSKIITNLQDLHVLHASKDVTDKTISVVAQYAPLLREIFISHSFGQITDSSIEKIALFCPLLRSISLMDSRGVTDKSISQISQLCQNLREVHISDTRDISDRALTALASRCRDLRVLDISHTFGFIGDPTIFAVAKHCARLEKLNVTGTAGAVTDKSIREIARNCKKLQTLEVGLTKGAITDESIIEVAEQCHGLRRLQIFSTQGKVTDRSVGLIAKNAHQLRELNVSYTFGKISNQTIIDVAERCPNLEVLNISNTHHSITDDALVVVAKRCRRLRDLNVAYCLGDVSDRGMREVAKYCKNLKVVSISGSEGKITKECVTELEESCRHVKIISH